MTASNARGTTSNTRIIFVLFTCGLLSDLRQERSICRHCMPGSRPQPTRRRGSMHRHGQAGCRNRRHRARDDRRRERGVGPVGSARQAMSERRTIVFFPEGAYGPTNNCVGIGNVLRDRGHRVVFVVEESFKGMLEGRGFEEALMRLGPPPEIEEAPGQFWKDFIRDTAPEFRRPTTDQLSTFLQPTWQALIDGSKYVNDRLTQILQELNPDVIVEDNVVAFPALPASGKPWVRIVSCNPLEVRDPDLPPTFSGYASDDRTQWDAFRAQYDRTHRPMWEDFDT